MQDYLGVGIKYPLEINSFGRISLSKQKELVRQSISRILQTPVGSTFMNRDFGSHLRDLIYEPNDTVLFNLLNYHIGDAIDKWEKRVTFISTDFEQPNSKPGVIHCIPMYRIRASNEIDSFIYPFYRELKY